MGLTARTPLARSCLTDFGSEQEQKEKARKHEIEAFQAILERAAANNRAAYELWEQAPAAMVYRMRRAYDNDGADAKKYDGPSMFEASLKDEMPADPGDESLASLADGLRGVSVGAETTPLVGSSA